jgi:SNF2 family DNA or RNA helicase
MLDVLEIELSTGGFEFTRIDGTKSEPKRREALDRFQTDDSCSILLASLGSVGVG